MPDNLERASYILDQLDIGSFRTDLFIDALLAKMQAVLDRPCGLIMSAALPQPHQEPRDIFLLYLKGKIVTGTLDELYQEYLNCFGKTTTIIVDLPGINVNILSSAVIRIVVLNPPEACTDALRLTGLRLAQKLLLEGLYKWRAKVRREIINTKILTNDLGSFCYKLCKELLPQYLQTEGVTIFINDKVAGILRLRGTSGLASGELLRDVVVEHSSRSWVAKAFSSGTALAEYSKHGSLVKGRTSENVLDIFSRIYWPIQVQHRLSEDVARRAKRDQVIGVIRLVNIESSYDKVNNNPFSILDFIRVAFLAELIYMMIESFSDLKVEGFDRDVAFHGASASADGILKNISMVESLLFGENEIYTTPRQFKLEPLHAIQDEVVRRCLRNALAYAHDLVGQIDRATPPQELLFASGSGAGGTPKVERLLSDVIIATEKLIPMQMTVHQLPHRYDFGYFVAGNKVQPFAKDGSFGPLPSPVLGETQDLISVFRNVFENCVKYKKPNGPLKIEVSFREDADFVHVRVRDYGIGVAEQDAARIFTRGVRTAEARDRQMRGGGLGLWHCRELLRKTRAQIKAEVMQDGLSIIVSLRRAK